VTWAGILTMLSLLFLLFWQLNRSNALIGSTLLFTLLLTLSQIANFLPGFLHVSHVVYVTARFVFEVSVGLNILLLAVVMSNVAGKKTPRFVFWIMPLVPILGLLSYRFSLGLILWVLLIAIVAVVVGLIVRSSFSKLKSDAWIIFIGIILVSGNMLLAMFTENAAWYNSSPWISFVNVSFIFFSIPVAMLIHITMSYTRLNRERNQRLEKEVAEATAQLKATMDQLVQQEKLASLGQLTAGIAHEIKNPLNFVNNFASVSLEQIEELKQDVDSFQLSVFGEDSPRKTENGKLKTRIDESILDIGLNLRKIHEHGTRADRIVKSMLLHARGGNGKREPTDVNALLQEYANLAYHGMRAGKNPVTVNVRYELAPDAGSIPLVAEDFSRVILNLCNNAFDALRESENRQLTVRSKRTSDSIRMEIEDNGPGIPDELKSKILEPFFTTKKGSDGTGLGLSISMDIIRAHGGSLSIEDAGPGARFVIRIPFQTLHHP
jgi:signal transduction histidine kinase